MMGWEYHNRERDQRGRFAETGKVERLMVRVTHHGYDAIRGRAYARHMSISEYILDLVRRDMLAELYEIRLPAAEEDAGAAAPANG